MNAFSLEGKVALVTCGSSGIGLESAKLLAARGAAVLITGRTTSRLEAAVDSIPGSAGLACDMAELDGFAGLANRIDDKADHLDVLVLARHPGCRSAAGTLTASPTSTGPTSWAAGSPSRPSPTGSSTGPA